MEINNKKEIEHQDTELRLGLPGTEGLKCANKRSFDDVNKEESTSKAQDLVANNPSPPKAQVVGWPPVRSYRKNSLQQAMKKEAEIGGMYVKVSMDGAPYLRKIDMKLYTCYPELLKALEVMFKVQVGSEYVPTYEDKDGDWMLVGDVPWEMFTNSCKRLRVMKGSEAQGLGCLA